MKNLLQLLLVAFVAFVLLQTLFFKFTGAEETKIIFQTVGDWMAGIGALEWAAPGFAKYGGYITGVGELIASVLLLVPKTRTLGALVTLGVISGAIASHLFTPLGVDRVVDAAGNTDGGQLFYMACAVFVSCVVILFLRCKQAKTSQA